MIERGLHDYIRIATPCHVLPWLLRLVSMFRLVAMRPSSFSVTDKADCSGRDSEAGILNGYLELCDPDYSPMLGTSCVASRLTSIPLGGRWGQDTVITTAYFSNSLGE